MHQTNRTFCSRSIIACSIALFLVTTTPAFAKNETIELEVSQQGALEMRTKSKCPRTATRSGYEEKGCVRANKHDDLSIEFKLKGKTNRGACTANGNQFKYQLSGIQIGGKNDSKPASDYWDNSAKNLDPVVVSDFNVNAQTGWVNVNVSDDNSTNNKKLTLFNANKSSAGYHIWYRVRATCSDPQNPHEIFFDPRIDNEGHPPR